MHRVLICLFVLCPVATVHAGRFRTVVLTEEFHSEGAAVADIDGDGDDDLVSGPFWYEGPEFRTRHAYAPVVSYAIKGYSNHFFSFVHDFNADGRPDVLSIPIPGASAVWFENNGASGEPWRQHLVLDGVGGESPTFADLTGDGRPELICIANGAFGYAEPDGDDPTAAWKFTPVTPHRNLGRFTHGMGIGDVDGDGRLDLLETSGWWRQTGAAGELFEFHPTRFAESGGSQMHVFDVDGDGDNDVVSVQNAHGWGLSWFERRGDDDDFLFVRHDILTDKPDQNEHGLAISQMHALAVADVDGDGVEDLITGKRFWAHGGRDPGAQQLPVLYWLRTVRTASGVTFEPRLIDERVGVGTQLTVKDVDRNGHIDIVVGNKLGTFLLLNTGDAKAAPQRRATTPYAPGTTEFANVVRTTEPLTPEQEAATFRLPAGFEVQLVAAEPDIAKPMNIAFDARGRLWVSSSVEYPFAADDGQGRDTIKVLEDTDGDGRADRITTFADGLNIPIGLYPYQDGVICFSIPNIWFLRDTDGDGQCDKREKLYGPFGYERDTHGMCNAFRRGFDGWLYACHGFNNETTVAGSDGHEISMQSGNTFRMRLDGSRIEQFTHGQVNPFGMALNPAGDIFTADCHTKPLTLLLQGGYYESFGKPHDGLGFVPPVMQHSHGSTAIGGVGLYHASQFPPVYHGNAFSGNVMTSRINRNSLHYSGSSVQVREEPDFLISGDPWFRPSDFQVGPDGALYVTDFYTRIIGHYEVPLDHPGRDRQRGRIWRIVYTGKDDRRDVPLGHPNDAGSKIIETDTVATLVAELQSPNLTRRMLAADQLADGYGDVAIAPARESFRNSSSAIARAASLRLLERLGGVSAADLELAVSDDAATVRIHAFQVIGSLKEPPADWTTWMQRGFRDAWPLVRRAAAMAATQQTSEQLLRPLLTLLHSTPANDMHLRHATRMALRSHLHDEATFENALTSASAADRAAIADVSLGIHTEFAGDFLVTHLGRMDNVERSRLAAFLTAAARNASERAVGDIAKFAREKFRSDLPFQEELLTSIRTGLQQRDGDLPRPVNDWAVSLARYYFDRADVEHEPIGWTYVPHPDAPQQPNPWVLSTRRDSADGRKQTPLFSSFPHGEQRIGTYRSGAFQLPDVLQFYVAGHDGFPNVAYQGKNLVRLHDAATRAVLKQWQVPRNDVAQPVDWKAGTASGRDVYLELIDGDAATAFAWLAVGRFSVAGLNPTTVVADRRKAAELAARFRLVELRDPLAKLLRQPRLDHATSAHLARAIAAMQPTGARAALAEGLALSSVKDELRREVVEAILGDDSQRSVGLVGSTMKVASADQQRLIANQLASDREGLAALVTLVEKGHAGARMLTHPVLKQRIDAFGSTDLRDRVATLTEGLPSVDPQLLARMQQRKQQYSSQPGDVARGAEVFRKSCAACHQIKGQGKQVGPNLDGIGNRGLARLIEDVLLPNRNVDVAFRSTTILTADGRVLSGLEKRTEGAQLILVNNKGEEVAVAVDDVEEKKKSTVSPMPANFAETLDEAKMNDLLSYLLSLTAS